MLWEQWDADDDVIRTKARWCTGEVARRMTRSVELMDAGETGGEWVRALDQWLRQTVAPAAAREFSDAKEASSRAALAYVLGGLRPPEMMALFEVYLAGANRDSKTDEVVLLSLASSRDVSNGVPLVREVIRTSEDPRLLRLALWTAGELYGLGTGNVDEAPADEELVRTIQTRALSMPFEVQCVLLDTLTRLRSEATNKVVFTLFETVNPVDKRCSRMELETSFGQPKLISRRRATKRRQKCLRPWRKGMMR